VLAEARHRIHEALRQGASLEQVEKRLIDPAAFSEEQKAALWLFASALAKRVNPASRDLSLDVRHPVSPS
jgi:nucleotidyltransferase/DNA polymerase involved in DNA repair